MNGLMRVGMGYDVHKLTEGRKLILGGVDIPWEKGLLGHSDAVLGSMRSFATKSFSSAASVALYPVVSKRVIGPIPTFPSFTPFQKLSTSFPIGVTAPSPVTTTRLFINLSS